MLLDRARERPRLLRLARAGSRLGVAGLLVLAAGNALQSAVAEGDTRTLSFHHVHTGEDITVTFKRNGRYDEAALKKLDWFMRDWRKEKETDMDPRLFDVLWQVYRETGATKPIEIICGYRSPGTNAMLRARSKGVARHSEHILGKAIDFFIPGVPLAKLRAAGLQLERGGVGFYPTSGSPFVHMDVGLVRHWPSIARQQLVKLFPDGRTVHIPADGKPLKNYAVALAEIERHGNAPNQRSLDAARAAGVITEGQVQEAALIAAHPQAPATLLASNAGAGSSALSADSMMAPAAAQHARAPVRLASALPRRPVAPVRVSAKHADVPLPTARPDTIVMAAAKRKKAPLMQTASLSGGTVIRNIWGDTRNIWGDVIRSGPGAKVAAADPDTTGSAGHDRDGDSGHNALAFAPEADATPVARVRPMGKALPRLPREATVLPGTGNTAVAVKPPMAVGARRADSPWLRAAMLTPSVSDYMTTSRLTKLDPKWMHVMLRKPAQAVMMSFSADPHLGMVTDRFTGHAVVFVATATFTPQTALSLR